MVLLLDKGFFLPLFRLCALELPRSSCCYDVSSKEASFSFASFSVASLCARAGLPQSALIVGTTFCSAS